MVQRFDHRNKFDVAEVENTNIAYQKGEGSDNEAVHEDMPSVTVNRPNTPRRNIDAYLVDRLMSRRNEKTVEEHIDSEPEVDETIQEYCSEKDDDEPADSDED